MRQSTREKKMRKLATEIKQRVKKLKELGYNYSDSASTIVLFDDRMFNRHFFDLTNEQQYEMQVDTLE